MAEVQAVKDLDTRKAHQLPFSNELTGSKLPTFGMLAY